MPKRFLYFVVALMVVLLFCVLGVLAISHANDPPTVWKDPPTYPGAQNLKVQDFGPEGSREDSGAVAERVVVKKIISFSVPDSETNIVSFYKRAFSCTEPSNWGRHIEAAKALDCSWTGGGRSPSVYFIDLVTHPAGPKQTSVEIGVSYFPGY
jgi:hypothetical protein